jgi:hypothetical protein
MSSAGDMARSRVWADMVGMAWALSLHIQRSRVVVIKAEVAKCGQSNVVAFSQLFGSPKHQLHPLAQHRLPQIRVPHHEVPNQLAGLPHHTRAALMFKHRVDDLLHELVVGEGSLAVAWLPEQHCGHEPQRLQTVMGDRSTIHSSFGIRDLETRPNTE